MEGRFVMNSPRSLPLRANLEHLRNQAKQRLKAMRVQDPAARLSDAQRAVAAAYTGDLDTVRRALDDGFNPGATDATGRTIHQIAKTLGHTDLELLMRVHQERDERRDEVKRAVESIHEAAAEGRADELQRLLDAHPDLLDARGVSWERQTVLHRAAWKNRLACVRLLL